MKTHRCHTKLPHRKPMLKQIDWWVQNWTITKNGVSPVTTLFFWKFCFSLRTFYKELIWCTSDPNVHIRAFCKRWSFIWRWFFPVSILNNSETVKAVTLVFWDICAKLGISNSPKSPHNGQNSNEGIFDFRISGLSLIKKLY